MPLLLIIIAKIYWALIMYQVYALFLYYPIESLEKFHVNKVLL